MSLFKRESRYYRLFPMFPHNLDQLQSIRVNSSERMESFSLKCYAPFFFCFSRYFDFKVDFHYIQMITELEEFLKLNQAERSLSITFSILRKNSSCYW